MVPTHDKPVMGKKKGSDKKATSVRLSFFFLSCNWLYKSRDSDDRPVLSGAKCLDLAFWENLAAQISRF